MTYHPVRAALSPWQVLLVCMLLTLGGCGHLDTPSTTAPQDVQSQANPTPTLAPLDATKQADDQRIAQERATAMVQYATAQAQPTPPTRVPRPPTSVPIPPQTGIEEDCDSLYARQYKDENCWSGVVNGEWLFVVAGAQPDASQQGIIGMDVADVTTGETGEFLVYTAPSANGPLVITQVVLPRVSVTAQSGAQYVFNLVTRRWEDVSMMPTSTPTPTRISTITPTGGPPHIARPMVAMHHHRITARDAPH